MDNSDNIFLFLFSKINDIRGDVGKGLSKLKGSFRLVKDNCFSPKYYNSGWRGGSRAKITTYNTSKFWKNLSKASNPLSYVMSGFNIFNGFSEDGNQIGENCKETICSEIGSYIGAEAGGKAGTFIGSLFMPGVGSAIGGIAGSIIGRIGGEILTSQARKYVKDWFILTCVANNKKLDKKLILIYFNKF